MFSLEMLFASEVELPPDGTLQRKPESWDVTVLEPQTKERRNIHINHSTSMFQLLWYCLTRPCCYFVPILQDPKARQRTV